MKRRKSVEAALHAHGVGIIDTTISMVGCACWMIVDAPAV